MNKLKTESERDKELVELLKEFETLEKTKDQNLKNMKEQIEKLSSYKEFFSKHPDFFMSVFLALNDEWRFIPDIVRILVTNISSYNTFDLINKGRKYIELSNSNDEYKKIIEEIEKYIEFIILGYTNDFNILRNQSIRLNF